MKELDYLPSVIDNDDCIARIFIYHRNLEADCIIKSRGKDYLLDRTKQLRNIF
jgi:hypothetical protein